MPLSDMEELLSRIANKDAAEYMREALGCYNGGAYRACIVLSYIAVFFDLRQKLLNLAPVSTVAKTISKEIEKRAEDQQIYESYMVDQLRTEQLITESDAFRLEQIRVLRNKAAHPSGIHASPEEARYVFFESIDKFLAQEVLKTTHGADAILARLKNDNFFPSASVDDVRAIVQAEMANLHPLANTYLIIQLVERSDSSDGALSKNASKFLSGLAANQDEKVLQELRSRLIVPKAEDGNKRKLLITLCCLAPKLLAGLDAATTLRLRNIFESSVDEERLNPPTQVSHPVFALPKLIDGLGGDYIDNNFHTFATRTTATFPYAGPVIKAVLGVPSLRSNLLKVWTEASGSTDFETANTFSTKARNIDSLFESLTEQEALRIVVNVCRAAAWNAFDAISLRNERFASTPVLRSRALSLLKSDPSSAELLTQEVGKSPAGFELQYLSITTTASQEDTL